MGIPTRLGQAREGVWGPHTALIDWCEQNYVVHSHVAEFFNTLSNIPFMAMAAYGAYRTFSEGLPGRFAAAYAGMATVGLGSFWFHATLKWEAQLCDELPMIWFSAYIMWAVFDSAAGFSFSARSLTSLVGLFSTLIVLTNYYVSHPNPLHHQILFGLILIFTTVRTSYLIRNLPASEAKAKKTISRLFATGVATFIAGFIAWNLDNEFCDTLQGWRDDLPFAVGVLLEGHAWWHLLTGLGVYLMVTSSNFLLSIVKSEGEGRSFEMVESFLTLPYVREVRRKGVANGKATNGHANGHANGNGKKHD